MRTPLVLLTLVAAGLFAPTASAQPADAAVDCDLPTIPEGTGPVVDAYEAADGFACAWVDFLAGGVPCVVATLPNDPVAVLLCYYPTLPIETVGADAASYQLPDEGDCRILVLQTGNIFAPGPVRDNYVFLGFQACTVYGVAHGLTGLPLLQTVLAAVGDVVDGVQESRRCTEETPIGQAPDAVGCWISISQEAQAAPATDLDAFWSCLFYEDRPFTDTRFCTRTIDGLEHLPVVDEAWDRLLKAA